MTGDGKATSLYAKLAEVIAEVGYVPKDSRNDFHGYNYTSAEALLSAVRGPLSARKVVVMPSLAALSEREYTTPKGKTSIITTAHVRFTFVDGESGETHECEWAGQGDDPADKGLSKAYTNAIKTFLREQFLIPQGDDPESDRETDDRAEDRDASRAVKPAAAPVGGLPADQVRQLSDMIRAVGVSGRWVRMNLIGLGLENVPDPVGPGALRKLTREQADVFRSRLNAELDTQTAIGEAAKA